MELSKAIQGYGFAATADGYSPVTITVYKSALHLMLEYLGDREVGKITTADLRSFMNYLTSDYTPERRNNPNKRDPLSTASLHRYWKAMRSFFKWAEEELHTGRPDLAIKMPQWESKEIVPFTEDEIRLLIKACDAANVPNGKKRKAYQFRRHNSLRDKCIILTLLDTGMRVGELTRLQISDVNLENGEVFIRPFRVRKTHSRTTFLGKTTRKLLWRYIASRDGGSRPDDPLFLTQDDRPMTRERVLANLKRLGASAGVRGVHPHRFRHTFAIQYLRNGGDIFTLQNILGHQSLDIVRHYLNLARADVQAAHQKASPVDRFRL